MDDNRAARKAHKAELRHSRKETRLHARAATAAARGHIGKAVALEVRAGRQHDLAVNAHNREVAAQVAGAVLAASHNNHCHHNTAVVIPTGVTQPHSTVTVVHQYEPTISYPTGPAVPPPSGQPPAGSVAGQYPAGSYPAPVPAAYPPPAYSTYPQH